MEILFQDNKLFIFFWIILSLIISNRQESNNYIIVIATYIISYLVCIIDAIQNVQAFMVVCIILFLHFEILVDEFKTKILNIYEMLVDFIYIMIFEYGFVYFLISLCFCSQFTTNTLHISHYYSIFFSAFILMMGCISVSRRKYKLKSFTSMKEWIDDILEYRKFLLDKRNYENINSVLFIEDREFFVRENNYTYLSFYFFKLKYIKKLILYIKDIIFKRNRKERFLHSLRGYSTIEMQTIRTLAVEEGYYCVFRRKIYELIYPYLFFRPLRRYYKKCNCDIKAFKNYMLYIYLNIAPVLIDGEKEELESCFRKKVKDVYDYSPEELFLLTLTFSGKIKRDEVFNIYSDIIEELDLDLNELQEKREMLVSRI